MADGARGRGGDGSNLTDFSEIRACPENTGGRQGFLDMGPGRGKSQDALTAVLGGGSKLARRHVRNGGSQQETRKIPLRQNACAEATRDGPVVRFPAVVAAFLAASPCKVPHSHCHG